MKLQGNRLGWEAVGRAALALPEECLHFEVDMFLATSAATRGSAVKQELLSTQSEDLC